MSLRAYFLNLISCPPTLGYCERGRGLYRFLNQVRLSRGRSRLVWLGLCRCQTSCDNDDFSTFAPISASSFSFLREHSLIVSIVPPPDIEAFYFFASSGFIRLTFCSESLLAFCDTLLGVAFFVMFLGLVRLSSFCVSSSNIARR